MDCEVRLAVQSRRIDDPIRPGWMLMNGHRPVASERLIRCTMDVRWNSHPNRTVISQIHEGQWRNDLDLGETAAVELVFSHEKAPYDAVALVAQHRLEETHLQRLTEMEHA